VDRNSEELVITLRAKLSGSVYCNRSCLWVCLFVCVCFWVCYHDISKLHASILTKLGLQGKVVTIPSWLNFCHPAPQGRRSAAGRKFLSPPYYSKRAMFASLSAFSFEVFLFTYWPTVGQFPSWTSVHSFSALRYAVQFFCS